MLPCPLVILKASVCPSGTVTIAASASVGTFTVSVLEDVEVEGVETFTVSITTVGASGLSVSLLGGGSSISVLIMDNDASHPVYRNAFELLQSPKAGRLSS